MKHILTITAGVFLAFYAMFMLALFIIIKVEGSITFSEPNTFILIIEIIFALFLVVLGLAVTWNCRQQKSGAIKPRHRKPHGS